MSVKRLSERLDQSYLDDLVKKTKQGSDDAFAELFTAVADRQLYYLMHLYGNREDAVRALEDVFARALREIGSLTDTGLFMPWISRLSALAFLEDRGMNKALNGRYTLSQLLNLPLAESQIMLMCCEQALSERDTGIILNVGKRTVKRFVKLGTRHLSRGSNAQQGDRPSGQAESTARPDRHAAAVDASSCRLGAAEAAGMLGKIFVRCKKDGNTVPMEVLSSYAVYRSERFSLQRGIVTAALILFMLLPSLFIIPKYSVSASALGERGLPVYTIEVESLLPVGKVLADVRGHRLPVYEAGAKEFTVEPTRNGTMYIRVDLINRQGLVTEYEVTDVDSAGPELTESRTENDSFRIFVKDAGIGVDYREIYAVDSEGNIHYPLSADENNGVIFEYPDDEWDVYIPDHIGNTLHLAVKLK